MTFHRPGVYTDEVLLSQTTPVNATTAVGAFIAAAKRGPVIPTPFSSWSEVTKAFGPFTGVAADDVLLQAAYDYLNAGGRNLYLTRVVGSGATAADIDLLLHATTPPGDAALHLVALNPGAWANQIYVEVTAGSDSTHVNLIVRLVPTGAAITNQQVVERWSDLSLDPADSRYALGILNSQVGGSSYLVASLSTSYTFTAGDYLEPSGTAGGDPLAGGADGSAPTGTELTDAIYTQDAITQPFVLNMPGITDVDIVTALADYADTYRNRQDDGTPGRGDVFVVLDTDPGIDADTAISTVATYPKSDVLAVYYPNLVVPDPSSSVRGATKLVPPGPAVVGRYIATDSSRGSFKSAAGITDGTLLGVLALDPAAILRNPQLDRLNDASVNAIKIIPNVGPVIYGARTLKRDYVTRYVSARRTLIGLRAELEAVLAFAPFENNDNILWSGLETRADKVCRELWAAGGLKGNSAEQAYYVKSDSSNNTVSTVELGEVHLEVGVALQRPAEFVVLTIAQFQGDNSVVESLDATLA